MDIEYPKSNLQIHWISYEVINISIFIEYNKECKYGLRNKRNCLRSLSTREAIGLEET